MDNNELENINEQDINDEVIDNDTEKSEDENIYGGTFH